MYVQNKTLILFLKIAAKKEESQDTSEPKNVREL